MLDLHTRGITLKAPLTLNDGRVDEEFDVSLALLVDYTVDVNGNVKVVEVVAQSATVAVAGVTVPARQESDQFLARFLAVPSNHDLLVERIEAMEQERPEPCPDPAYQRAVANGRMILPNGRDVS